MLTASAIHKHLQKANKVMIVPHQNPDGDAIGSAIAFHEYVTSLRKPAVIFCVTPLNEKLAFVAQGTPVYSDPKHFSDPDIDTIVTLDSGDLRYNGIAEHVKEHPATIINIDHHATNEHFGHINLVIPTAASTTEVLFRFFRHNRVRISQKMATSLLTGLTTDTGNFTNAATSSSALQASGELILLGGNFNLVKSQTLKNKSVEALRLWGRAFSRLQKDERLGITHTFLTQADLRELGASEHEYEGISNFFNNIENTNITLLLVEKSDGTIKASFRTTRDDVDVSAIAKSFGGGGHKKAAAFSMVGTIEEILNKVLTHGSP
jgi:phosphoesterase RecJ-like protein